jgi:hypothetical protein
MCSELFRHSKRIFSTTFEESVQGVGNGVGPGEQESKIAFQYTSAADNHYEITVSFCQVQ